MRWGYSFPGDRPVINARVETAADKPLFRDGMKQRRCLIPASHYFEWARQPGQRTKYALRPAQRGTVYLAGIYHLENHDGDHRACLYHPDPGSRHGDRLHSPAYARYAAAERLRRLAEPADERAGARRQRIDLHGLSARRLRRLKQRQQWIIDQRHKNSREQISHGQMLLVDHVQPHANNQQTAHGRSFR